MKTFVIRHDAAGWMKKIKAHAMEPTDSKVCFYSTDPERQLVAVIYTIPGMVIIAEDEQ